MTRDYEQQEQRRHNSEQQKRSDDGDIAGRMKTEAQAEQTENDDCGQHRRDHRHRPKPRMNSAHGVVLPTGEMPNPKAMLI